MAERLITSADAVFVLTVQQLFNAPIVLENWSSNRAWDTQGLKLADTRMSVDGKLNRGYVPAALDMTLHFSPNSKTFLTFDAIATASRQARTVYNLNAEITLKGLERKYTFVNGAIIQYSGVPSAGELLEDVSVEIRWEDVLPAGL